MEMAIYEHKGQDFEVKVFPNWVEWKIIRPMFEPNQTMTVLAKDIADVQVSGDGFWNRVEFLLVTRDNRRLGFVFTAGGKHAAEELRAAILSIVH